MNEYVCYVANILARQGEEVNGLQCFVALIASHTALKCRDCANHDLVGASGGVIIMFRRGEVEERTSRVATKPQI